MRASPALLALVVSIATACGSAGSAPADQRPASAAAGPNIVPLAEAERQVAGKPVVYLFTAPGCVSCAAEARALASAARSRPQVQLVGVDLRNDSPANFASYVAAIGLGNSPFVWTIDQDGSLARLFGIASLSSTVFVDSGGKVRFTNSGDQDEQTLSAQLSQLA
jgi:thiol-disulfide isomerase/thioredoxin